MMFTLCAAQNGGRKKGGREINGAIMGSTLITWKIAVRQGCQVLGMEEHIIWWEIRIRIPCLPTIN